MCASFPGKPPPKIINKHLKLHSQVTLAEALGVKSSHQTLGEQVSAETIPKAPGHTEEHNEAKRMGPNFKFGECFFSSLSHNQKLFRLQTIQILLDLVPSSTHSQAPRFLRKGSISCSHLLHQEDLVW